MQVNGSSAAAGDPPATIRTGGNIMQSKTTNTLLGATAFAMFCTAAAAHDAGDWLVRAGYAAVDPRDDSSRLRADGSDIAGTGAGVDGAGALGLTVGYMIAPHWGIELLAATPFKHDISVKGLGALGVADGTRIGSTKQLPPTLSAQYYFAAPTSRWQPYVGLGVNYTVFFDENTSGAARSQLGAHNLSLSNSWGIAGELGIDWQPDSRWLLNASVWRIDIRTDATLDTAVGRVKTSVDIDPWVYMVAAGYRF
jgi:outer membrane protein